MIALVINGLLLLGCSMAARPAEVMVLGSESRATLIADRELPKRCRYNKVASMLQARCYDLGYKEIPHNLPTDVEILDFTNNKLRRVTNDTFSRYTSLAYLYLQDNVIMLIEEGAFSKLRSLQVLDLTRNAFQHFPMSTLSLPVLRKLYLGFIEGAELLSDSAFERTTFPEESSLQFLELSQNALTRLPFFGNLPWLTQLNVSANSIKSITLEQLAPFCAIEILDLSKNAIKFDPSTCDCQMFNAWIRARKIKMKPEKFVCVSADASCSEFTGENPIFPNETLSIFDSCREVIRVRAESAKARSTWILVASCVGSSLVCLFLVLYCIHRRNGKMKKRQRLKQQKEQQLAANNANTELLNGNMPPEQT